MYTLDEQISQMGSGIPGGTSVTIAIRVGFDTSKALVWLRTWMSG